MRGSTASILTSISFAVVMASPVFSQPISFVAPREFDVGERPLSLAVADFNGDGVNDLAVVISSNPVLGENVAIVLGEVGGFGTPQIVFRSTGGLFSIAAADFNGDGKADLAVVANAPFGGPGGVAILLGNGDGTFGEPSSFSNGTSSPSRGIALGDFNNDGKLDIVVTNMGPSYSVSVLLGNGDGTFQSAIVMDLGVQFIVPWSVAAGDFNEDGSLDVVVGLHSGSRFLLLLLGDGQGGFQPPVRYETCLESQSVAVADFNRDGHADVAVACQGVGVGVLLGNGDGTLQPAVNYAVAGEPVWLAVGDFNNDAVPDLVTANYRSQDASVLFGTGDGTFQPPLNLDAGSHPVWVVTGDFNGDGISDFAVSDDLGASVAVVLSNGNGSFRAQPSLLRGAPTWASVAGDFNGDGLADLAVTNNFVPGTIEVMLSRGDGTFVGPIHTPLPRCAFQCGPVALAAADFNRDGKLDLCVAEANVGIYILLGNGDGTFNVAAPIDVGRLGFNTASLVVSDFNNDGIPDWAVSVQGDNAVVVALGIGDGRFRAPLGFLVENRPQAIAAADFNQDGFQDLVVTNLFSHTFSLLLGRGDGTFEPAQSHDTVQGSAAITVGDFNGDGFADVVVTGGQGMPDRHNSVRVFLGNGDGTFQPPTQFPAGIYDPFQVIAADLNGDGKQDLVVGDALANSVSVLLGDGEGGFGPAFSFATGNHPNSISIGDFNGDGKPGLATANIRTDVGVDSVSVLINDTNL